MKIVALIPSRFDSSRFRGKPLVKIGSMTMIERVYRQVEKSQKFESIIVATDDNRIAAVVKSFGGEAVLTSPNHRSGTDRIWEVVKGMAIDGIVNIQGDEPLISENLISDLYNQLEGGQDQVVSAAFFNTKHEDFISNNIVKVVFNQHQQALYFSRGSIPHKAEKDFEGFYQHVGIYGYLKGAIEKFITWPPSRLELIENLEQLRFLDNGIPIRIIQTNYQSIGVDVPVDVEKIENLLADKNA